MFSDSFAGIAPGSTPGFIAAQILGALIGVGLVVALYPGETMRPKPVVLFLCTHNAGRSQMALGYFNHLAGGQAVALSGGSQPADEINPSAVQAMEEVGIDIASEFPKPWTDETVQAADVVVTMGCGDSCPFFPGKRYEEWDLPDPAGQSVDSVRPIRDEIERRVRALLVELGVRPIHQGTGDNRN
jgi:protein-tyrosine-phosphatase